MYEIVIEQQAKKYLKKLPQEIRFRINNTICTLSNTPRPMGSVKLKGSNFYRIRVSDYRIIYEIQDNELILIIIFIGHRKDVYRNIK